MDLRVLIDNEPFTNEELDCGIAIRLASCVRFNDVDPEGKIGGFFWSVVVFSSGAFRRAPLRLNAPSRLLAHAFGGAVESLVHEELVMIEGQIWSAQEYVVAIPRRVLFFGFRAGCAHLNVSRARRNELVLSRFEEIRNAYADENEYGNWLNSHRRWLERSIMAPNHGPLISIVTPVYKTPPDYLKEMIDSVVNQYYGTWELVLVNASPDDVGVANVIASYDDKRIKVIEVRENLGIVGNTNLALESTTGDYVAFLDHDDVLEPTAIAAIVDAINEDFAVDLLYCDEDSYVNGRFKTPLFKPDFNWDLLLSNNFVIHFLVISRRALSKVERSLPEAEGAQDYDLTFKAAELGGHIKHLPYVLYHWRMHSGSTNANADNKPYAQEAGRLMIQRHLERCDIKGSVIREKENFTYRTNFNFIENVSIARFSFPKSRDSFVKCIQQADAQIIFFCNDDVTIDDLSIDLMQNYFARSEVFSVVPKILRKEGLVESAGCVITPDGDVVKLGKGLPAADPAYIGRAMRPCDHVVATGDCIMMRLGALKERLGFTTCYETSDYALHELCTRAYLDGMVNVFTPFAVAQICGERSLLVDWPACNQTDRKCFAGRYRGLFVHGDPTHNPNLNPSSPYYRLGNLQTIGWPADPAGSPSPAVAGLG